MKRKENDIVVMGSCYASSYAYKQKKSMLRCVLSSNQESKTILLIFFGYAILNFIIQICFHSKSSCHNIRLCIVVAYTVIQSKVLF
uniref:Uncharacterized protein n=1 Tax=Arundo donax TaxID=35708 RepID=A0A0A9DSN4_ARUDO